MSLSIKNYKEVTRSFFNRVLLSNGTSGVTPLEKIKIETELTKNKFLDENLHVICWRIHYDRFSQIERLEPIFDD